MKNTTIFLWLMSCLLLLLPPLAFTQDSDPGDTGYKPPPYYTPQTAQVAPSFTATMIAKPPISSYTSAPEPFMAQNYGSDISVNMGSTNGPSSVAAYNSVPVRYIPAAPPAPWLSTASRVPTSQPADSSDTQQENN